MRIRILAAGSALAASVFFTSILAALVPRDASAKGAGMVEVVARERSPRHGRDLPGVESRERKVRARRRARSRSTSLGGGGRGDTGGRNAQHRGPRLPNEGLPAR